MGFSELEAFFSEPESPSGRLLNRGIGLGVDVGMEERPDVDSRAAAGA